MYIPAIQETNGHSGKQERHAACFNYYLERTIFFILLVCAFLFALSLLLFTLPFSINADDCFLMKCLWLSGLCLSLRRRSSALGRAHHIPAPRLQAVVQIRKQKVQVGLTFSGEGIGGG